jgi:hypothetical protein
VLKEPVIAAGDALGHAGKTSEMFRRGRAANGSIAAIIDPIDSRGDPPY